METTDPYKTTGKKKKKKAEKESLTHVLMLGHFTH